MQVNSEIIDQRFENIAAAKVFCLAGNATITLESLKTSAHFTYKVREKAEEGRATVWFVSLLSGCDNENDYRYMGIIRDGRFSLTRNSKISCDALSFRAFDYFWNRVHDEDPAQLVIHHEGRCGRCGRTLTVPSSIQSGLGPDCAEIMGLNL
jgi:Family of unknown function (DUF6011)